MRIRCAYSLASDSPRERRIAVITGGSSGIGAALARRLSSKRWHCVLVARGEERLRAVAEEVGGEYELADVSDRAAVERIAETVRSRHSAVKLLVNNAGIPGRASFLSADADRIERVTKVNYLGAVWCLRAFLPALEAARPAHVVNVVSIAGTVAFPSSGPYSASKYALLAFSRATAAELAPRAIAVHTVNPGLVETEGFPQRAVLLRPLLRRIVVDPELVADHIVRAIERGKPESYVPAWYRLPAIVQAVAPGTVARLLGRHGLRARREDPAESGR